MNKKELKNKITELEKELCEAHNTERVLREIIALMKEQKCAYPQPPSVLLEEKPRKAINNNILKYCHGYIQNT